VAHISERKAIGPDGLRHPLHVLFCTLAIAVIGLGLAPRALAQDIEPRLYSNVPVGVNFLITGYTYTQGGLAFDSSLPVSKPNLATNTGMVALSRAMDFWGLSGKVDAVVPYTWLSGSADYLGESVTRNVSGFADPLFRVSVNLYGAPALGLSEFRSYEQDLIIGAALQVSVPLGQYDDTRLINIGTNRWFFKPSLGISKTAGLWTLEATAAATFFTDNTDFYGGHDRGQDPLYSVQAHLIRSFPKGIWGSVSTTYFTGGSTTLDGVEKQDLQRNWRVGATLALPVNRQNSIKFLASDGVSSRTGNSYTLYSVAWQYRWGGGP
jgi:hypothetical protein